MHAADEVIQCCVTPSILIEVVLYALNEILQPNTHDELADPAGSLPVSDAIEELRRLIARLTKRFNWVRRWLEVILVAFRLLLAEGHPSRGLLRLLRSHRSGGGEGGLWLQVGHVGPVLTCHVSNL